MPDEAAPFRVGDCLLIGDQPYLTSRKHRRPGSDTSCALPPGVHPFITHASVISYRHARALTVEAIQRLIADGFAVRHEQGVSMKVVSWIIAGARRTQFHGDDLGKLLPSVDSIARGHSLSCHPPTTRGRLGQSNTPPFAGGPARVAFPLDCPDDSGHYLVRVFPIGRGPPHHAEDQPGRGAGDL